MTMLRSATRISLLVLIVALPVLTWFGKLPPEVFRESLSVVLLGFFASGRSNTENGAQPK